MWITFRNLCISSGIPGGVLAVLISASLRDVLIGGSLHGFDKLVFYLSLTTKFKSMLRYFVSRGLLAFVLFSLVSLFMDVAILL